MNHVGRGLMLATALVATGSAVTAWGVGITAAAWSEAEEVPLVASAEAVVTAAAGLGLATGGAWLAVVTVVCLVDLLRGHGGHDGYGGQGRGALRPRAVRLALLRACAPTLTVAVVCVGGPTAAETGDLEGLPLPDRPVTQATTDPTPERPGAVARAVATRRTVLPGDCLWSIAADLLGPHASPADVDQAWRAIYRDNRPLVGADPDLLRPGTRLAVPATLRHTSPPSR